MIIDKLVAMLGFQLGSTAPVKKYEQTLNGLTGRATKGMAAATAATAGFGRTLGRIGALVGVGVAGRAMKGFAGNILQAGAGYENYVIALQSLGKSHEEAIALMEKFTTLGRKTAFTINDVRDAGLMMMKAGIDPFEGDFLQHMGDVLAVNPNKSLEQWMMAIEDAVNFQFKRLPEFGINPSKDSKKGVATFGFNDVRTGEYVTKEVALTRDALRQFFLDYASMFDGAQKMMAESGTGIISQFEDFWLAFKAKIANSGFYAFMKEQGQKMLKLVDGLGGEMGDTVDDLATAISNKLTNFAKAIGGVTENLMWAFKNWDSVRPYIMGLVSALSVLFVWAFPVISGLIALGYAVNALATYARDGSGPIKDLFDYLSNTSVASTGDQIAGSLNAINEASASLGTKARKWVDSIDWQGLLVAKLTEAGMALSNWFDSFDFTSDGSKAMNTFIQGIKDAWFAAIDELKSMIANLFNAEAWGMKIPSFNVEAVAPAMQNANKSWEMLHGGNLASPMEKRIEDNRNQSIKVDGSQVTVNVTTPQEAAGQVGSIVGGGLDTAVKERAEAAKEPALP